MKPFWVKDSSPNISNQLWLPSDSYKSPPLEHSEHFFDFWLSKSSPQQSLFNSRVWNLDEDIISNPIKPSSRIISRKIRLYPNHPQKLLFKKCYDAHRFFYNKTVCILNQHYTNLKNKYTKSKTCIFCKNAKITNSFTCSEHKNTHINWTKSITLPNLKKQIMLPIIEETKWQENVPYDTRALAIKDAITAFTSCTSNLNNNNIKDFKMHYKSRKNVRQIFWIDNRAINTKDNTLRIFPRRLKKPIFIRKRQQEKLPPMHIKGIKHAAKILYDRGVYYFIFSIDEAIVESKKAKQPFVALDPGIRTFQTGYSPSGVAFKTSNIQTDKLKQLNIKLDILRSEKDKSQNTRQRKRRKRRCLRVEREKTNIVENMHNQLGHYLTENYENILLPVFTTSQLQKGTTLPSKTKRAMQDLSHYKFRTKLLDLCTRDSRNLYIIGEQYTSQTCGQCGKLQQIGKLKEYNCECGYQMDRDINGARNILLKTLTEYGEAIVKQKLYRRRQCV